MRLTISVVAILDKYHSYNINIKYTSKINCHIHCQNLIASFTLIKCFNDFFNKKENKFF